jgi:hypothetical protein
MDDNDAIIQTMSGKQQMKRFFTVQSLTNSEILILSIANLQKMKIEFYDAFKQLF